MARRVKEERLARFSMSNPGMRVVVILSSDPAATADALLGTGPGGRVAADAMWVRVNDVACYLIFDPRQLDVPLIAHECLHATTDVMRKSGVGFSTSNDEIIAHYQSDMIRRVILRLSAAGIEVPLVRGRRGLAGKAQAPIGSIPRRRLPPMRTKPTNPQQHEEDGKRQAEPGE